MTVRKAGGPGGSKPSRKSGIEGATARRVSRTSVISVESRKIAGLANRTIAILSASSPLGPFNLRSAPTFIVNIITDVIAGEPTFRAADPLKRASYSYLLARRVQNLAEGEPRITERLDLPARTIRDAGDVLMKRMAMVQTEEKICAALEKNPPPPSKSLETPDVIWQILSPHLAEIARFGSIVAHNAWYAEAAVDTMVGERGNDAGTYNIVQKDKSPRELQVRARPFFMTSYEIQRSENPDLIRTLFENNRSGIEQAIRAFASAAGQAGTFFEKKQGSATKEPLSDGVRNYLARLGCEIAQARKQMLAGELVEWKHFPLAHRALEATHHYWLEENRTSAHRSLKKPFNELSRANQGKNLPVVIAAIYATLVELKVIDEVPLATHPGRYQFKEEITGVADREAEFMKFCATLRETQNTEIVTFEDLVRRLQGRRVIIPSGYSGLGYQNPGIFEAYLDWLLRERGDGATYVGGGTADGVGRFYSYYPERAARYGYRDIGTAGIMSKNGVKYGIAPQNQIVLVDTSLDDWTVKRGGGSLFVELAKRTRGELVYFRGGAVCAEEAHEALTAGVAVTIVDDPRLSPREDKVAKKLTTDRRLVVDGTAEILLRRRDYPSLSVVGPLLV